MSWYRRFQKMITEDAEGKTYYVIALTNDHRRLIASETSTTEREIADMVAEKLEADGYIVTRREIG